MRKFEQKQLLELMNTIKDANGVLENLFLAGKMEEFQAILASEQTAAVSIGTKLEETAQNVDDNVAEQVTKTVHLLEEYCELLWHTNNSQDINILKENVNKLGSYTEKIEKAIREVPVRLEVVFLPYKASMWDCMETVWKAANEDPDCDTYVIPIPYFDVKDGKAEEIHYEADMMPTEIPITDYREYKLEEKRPDVIFIHNPFDGYNRVTSVHPNHYCTELKKYTDMLVYIPYFITHGPMPSGQINVPSYKVIDKIILQSEQMIEQFDDDIKDKLVVLGNPKADRILRLESEKEKIIATRIPKDWKTKIQGKKVILYNISITGILENSKTALSKIRNTIDKFSHRDDVVLLWRPHPLTETTLQSMRPEMYQEYLEIKNSFIKEDKGIFDENGDAGVSATIADAYIGENTSSLVHYFGVNGKPVLYTRWKDIDEWTEEERRSLFFSDCYFEDGYAWFVSRASLAYNYLSRMNLETGKVELYKELPGEFHNPVKGNAYYGICKQGNKVLLAPVWTSDIYLYDIETGQGIKIPLRESEIAANFAKVHKYKDKFILQPRNYSSVVMVDVNTGNCEYYDIPDIANRRKQAEYLFGISSCIIENRLFIPSVYTNSVLLFDMEKRVFEEKIIEGVTGGFYSVANIDNNAWLIGNGTSNIVQWDITSGEIEIFKEFPEGFVGGKQPFRGIEDGDGFALVFPENANMIIRIDKQNRKLEKIEIQENYQEGERLLSKCAWSSNYWFVKGHDNQIVALSAYNNGLLQYDAKYAKCRLSPCMLEKSDMKKLEAREWNRFYKNDNIPNACGESDRWSLSAFLDYIAGDNYNYHKQAKKNYEIVLANSGGECGKNIYDYIKSNIE